MMHVRHDRRGATLVELLSTAATIAVIGALTLPLVAHVGSASRTSASIVNVTAIGAAHAIYALDWNGRQVTWIPDDFTSYGATGAEAWDAYAQARGEPPYVNFGWGCDVDDPDACGLWRIASYGWRAAIPFDFEQSYGPFGAFRIPYGRPFHEYLDGRVYSPVFFPPNDEFVRDVVHDLLDEPDEYLALGFGQFEWPSYSLSAAAMLSPDVMRAPSQGGWQNPYDLDDGHASPGLAAVVHPALKTLVLEHHWNQNRPPDPCNPALQGPYENCDPWHFNHGWASAPVTAFYDLSARMLPNTEAFAADETIMMQTGEGLWSRDTPLGATGYQGDAAYDDLLLSHHVLTIDGIRGRDTVAGAAPSARSFAPRSGMSDRAVSARRRAPGLELRATTN